MDFADLLAQGPWNLLSGIWRVVLEGTRYVDGWMEYKWKEGVLAKFSS